MPRTIYITKMNHRALEVWTDLTKEELLVVPGVEKVHGDPCGAIHRFSVYIDPRWELKAVRDDIIDAAYAKAWQEKNG